jgi:hypothetical protein
MNIGLVNATCSPEFVTIFRDAAKQPPTRRKFGEWLATERGRRWLRSRRRRAA